MKAKYSSIPVAEPRPPDDQLKAAHSNLLPKERDAHCPAKGQRLGRRAAPTLWTAPMGRKRTLYAAGEQFSTQWQQRTLSLCPGEFILKSTDQSKRSDFRKHFLIYADSAETAEHLMVFNTKTRSRFHWWSISDKNEKLANSHELTWNRKKLPRHYYYLSISSKS